MLIFAIDIQQPNLVPLIQNFLYDQLNPAQDPNGTSTSNSSASSHLGLPNFNLPISVDASALALSMHHKCICAIPSWRQGPAHYVFIFVETNPTTYVMWGLDVACVWLFFPFNFPWKFISVCLYPLILILENGPDDDTGHVGLPRQMKTWVGPGAVVLHLVTSCNAHKLITDKFLAHSGFQYPFLPPPHDFRDSWKPNSMLNLVIVQLLILNTIYSKVLPLVLLLPCHHVLTIHVFRIYCVSAISCLSLTLHPSHLHFPWLMLCHWLICKALSLYDIFMFEYQLWFLSLTTWTCLNPRKDPFCSGFLETLCHSRDSSFILDLYAPLSLDDAPVPYFTSELPDHFQHFWNSSESPEYTWNTWTRVWGGLQCMIWKPTSKPLSVLVE